MGRGPTRSGNDGVANRLFTIAALAITVAAFACGGPRPGNLEAAVDRGALVTGINAVVIQPGEYHRYRIDVPAHHAVVIELAQDTLDLVARVRATDDTVVLDVDRPLGTVAPEVACWISPEDGQYVVDIDPYEPINQTSTYILTVQPPRLVTPANRQCVRASFEHDAADTGDVETRDGHMRTAADAWVAAGQPLQAAVALRQAGSLFEDQDAYEPALDRYARALTLANNAPNGHRLTVSILNRIGMTHLDADDHVAASSALTRALAIARAHGDRVGEATTLTNSGAIANEIGDPFRALDWSREAVAMWRQIDSPIEVAQTLANLGEALGALDHHDEALDALDEALTLVRGEGELDREAAILTYIGWVHRLAGAPKQGLPALHQALAMYRARGNADAEIAVLDRLGTTTRLAGDPRAAEAHYRHALALNDEHANDSTLIGTRVNLGCLLAETDRHAEAAEWLTAGVAYLEGIDDPRALSHARYCQARLARHQGHWDDAARLAHDAVTIIESIHARARARGHRFPPVALWQDYADFEVRLRIERYRRTHDPDDLANAFAAADRSRARRLSELAAFTRGGSGRASSQGDRQRTRAIQQRLATLAAQRLAPPTPEIEAEIGAEIRRQQRALERVRARQRARSADPSAAAPRIDVRQARALLDPTTVLVTYVLGNEGSHLMVLSHDALALFDLPPRTALETHAEGLHAALADSRDDDRQWLLIADRLGPMLLPPAAVPATAKRLMISAQGALHYVPFAALASPRAPLAAQASTPPRRVLDDFETVQIPSASVLAVLRARHTEHPAPPPSVAVFADPVFSAQDERVAGHTREPATNGRRARSVALDRLPTGPLPRLPATAEEATAIRALLPASNHVSFLGWDATKQAILDTDLRPFRYLHFATHAWVDERFPELSGLVLTSVDQQGQPSDGALYLHDIAGLDLAADLTVLSGCQTALGRQVRGDGMQSLAQGFFDAGSRQLLVSLWSVDDVATSRLMAVFYRRLLAAGERPAAALRHAQQWLRQQPGYEAPRYWAPFVLQGDG